MKKFGSLLLAILLVFALVGCGPSDEEKIIGTWVCECDITEYVQELFDKEEYYTSKPVIESMQYKMYYAFLENGSYTLWTDKESFDSAHQKVLDNLRTAFLETWKVFLEETANEHGMTLKGMLARLGYDTMEELIEDELDMSMDEIIASLATITGDFRVRGKFTLEDGMLKQYNYTNTRMETYVFIDNDTLVLDLVEGAELPEGEETLYHCLYPMTLTRVK